MDKFYLENDLGTAAFLIVKEFKLIDLVETGRERYSFRFDDTEGNAANAAMGYLRGESVPARDLIAAEKSLKSMLYAKKNVRNGNGYGNGRGKEAGSRSER